MKNFDDDKRRPSLSELEALIAIADTGSFSAAAAELDCTQSRISHAIAKLESSIGLQILERSRTGTLPTAAGTQIVTKAREILVIVDSMISLRTEPLQGTVRLATYQSVATHILPSILDDVSRRHPAIRIEVDDGCVEREDAERRLRDGSADLGIALTCRSVTDYPCGPSLKTTM